MALSDLVDYFLVRDDSAFAAWLLFAWRFESSAVSATEGGVMSFALNQKKSLSFPIGAQNSLGLIKIIGMGSVQVD